MERTLQLPASTEYRCSHRGCTYRAVGRIWLDIKGISGAGSAQHYCRHHLVSNNSPETEVALARMGWVEVVEYFEAPLCVVCGNPLNAKGQCPNYLAMVAWSRESFSCGCVICSVYGGDCARSAARDGMWDEIRQHQAATRAALGRTILAPDRGGWARESDATVFDRYDRDYASHTARQAKAERREADEGWLETKAAAVKARLENAYDRSDDPMEGVRESPYQGVSADLFALEAALWMKRGTGRIAALREALTAQKDREEFAREARMNRYEEMDTITEYGVTARLSRSVRVF